MQKEREESQETISCPPRVDKVRRGFSDQTQCDIPREQGQGPRKASQGLATSPPCSLELSTLHSTGRQSSHLQLQTTPQERAGGKFFALGARPPQLDSLLVGRRVVAVLMVPSTVFLVTCRGGVSTQAS